MANRFVSALRSLGGAPDLDKYPAVSKKTQHHFTAQGLAVITTALLSGFSASVSLGLVISLVVGLIWGPVWAGVILLINFFVGGVIEDALVKGWRKVIGPMLVAVLLITAVSYFNSSSVLMYLFRSEIHRVTETEYREKLSQLDRQRDRLNKTYASDLLTLRTKADNDLKQIGSVPNTIQKLEVEEAGLRRDYQAALTEVNKEADGKAASGQAGVGSRAKLKQQTADNIKGLLDAKVAELSAARARANSSSDTRANEIRANLTRDEVQLKSNFDEASANLKDQYEKLGNEPRYGFIDQQKALHSLFWESPIYMSTVFTIFFVMEGLFIFLKIFSGRKDYHLLRAVDVAALEKEAAQKKAAKRAEHRAVELADARAEAAHRDQLAVFAKAEHARQTGILQEYLQQLRDREVSEEDIDAARKQWLRKYPLKLVG